ncbi:ORF MSV194 ALI motif gene family protein [Melanoplus sanguinipes entomopoxvirus]|uniref:ORF MSV194 ALI motif gene family protein n=1 Tax=Melanoplus sanguinipes entomopoxvirus TaxID=83191 RepID=Q9YVP8_MSEPV|nr:ORF MSV194 ALI motif gene family protein [Melanoplus sanguinipes entomopoxvirus]AAC97765.1 ORF MSV194 ALI motif gene family protein [Melanoplus sanguinipes entomopoxvirus 'O']
MDLDNLIFNNKKIHIAIYENKPYFKGKDIAEILEYKDTNDAIKKHVDDDDKSKYEDLINRPGILPSLTYNEKNTIYISESGLYSLILSSKKSEAKIFKKWITNEVLPNIRKHGEYKIKKELETLTTNFQNLLTLKEQEKEQLQQQLNQEKEQLQQQLDQENKIKEELEKQKKLNEQYKEYCNRLQKLEKNEIIYVLTNNTDLSKNIFKIGKTNINSIKNRLSTYNTGASDPYYYVFYKEVYDATKIEKDFNTLMNRYNINVTSPNKTKLNNELYKLYYLDLEYVLNAVIDSNDTLINIIKEKHEEFYINSINKQSVVYPIIFEDNITINRQITANNVVIKNIKLFDSLSSNEKEELLKEAFEKYNKTSIKRKEFEEYFTETFDCKVDKKLSFWNDMKSNCPNNCSLHFK